MTGEDEELVKRMKTRIAEYEKTMAEREQKAKTQKDGEITHDDLQRFLNMVNKAKTEDQPTREPPVIQTTEQQPVQKGLSKDKEIALALWKDAKSTSIVCLIAIVLPFIGIMVAMFEGTYAMVIALGGIVYPCFVFVRSVAMQSRIYKKYGLKPMFQMPQQPVGSQQNVKQNQMNRGGLF